jgi:tripartite-type tricarboxylate transporter receptor subunit TctC
MRRRSALAIAAALCVCLAAGIAPASAQSYPSRPITLVVPFPPGGATDAISRILIEQMRGVLGQPLVVENVAGAGGNTGIARVWRAEADGYTLVIGHWGSHVVNGATYTLSYDLVNDFEPIAWIASTPQWIITRKTMPANNLQELVAWVKANTATAGTIGAAGPGVVAGAYFQKLTDASFTYVPYRGGGPAIQDLVAGQIDLLFDQAANSLSQYRSGNVKAYAVMAPARWAPAPEVPTVDEAGVPKLYATYWHGMWAPKGTPKDVIAKLNGAIVTALADPGVREKFADLGQDIPPVSQQTPEALAAQHKAEIEKWWPIIKAANIKATD